MKGIKLTLQQKQSCEGKFIDSDNMVSVFCSQNVNNEWFTFLSEDDRSIFTNEEIKWLLDLPEVDFVQKIITM